MIKPKCLLSENVDDHNWDNMIPGIGDGPRRCDCLDCFCSYYCFFYDSGVSTWSHHEHIFKGVDEDVIENIIRSKNIREKVGVYWPNDHMYNKLKDRK
jgi:hypothetical protein